MDHNIYARNFFPASEINLRVNNIISVLRSLVDDSIQNNMRP
jgi:hypothetical protein